MREQYVRRPARVSTGTWRQVRFRFNPLQCASVGDTPFSSSENVVFPLINHTLFLIIVVTFLYIPDTNNIIVIQ